jgi:hypothetical protein
VSAPPPLRMSFWAPPCKESLPPRPQRMSLPAVPVILSIPVVPVLLQVGTVWRPCGGCVLHRVVGQASGLVGGGVLDLRLYGVDLVVGPGVGEGRRVPVALEDDPRAFGQPVRYRVGSRRIVGDLLLLCGIGGVYGPDVAVAVERYPGGAVRQIRRSGRVGVECSAAGGVGEVLGGVVADVISLGYRLHCPDVEVAVSFANEGDL